jgi:hypothetical protein
MEHLNQWLAVEKNNYLLIGIAAILFFGIKSLFGYLTYRRFMKELAEIKKMIKDKNG